MTILSSSGIPFCAWRRIVYQKGIPRRNLSVSNRPVFSLLLLLRFARSGEETGRLGVGGELSSVSKNHFLWTS
jgi:hypothetical protein